MEPLESKKLHSRLPTPERAVSYLKIFVKWNHNRLYPAHAPTRSSKMEQKNPGYTNHVLFIIRPLVKRRNRQTRVAKRRSEDGKCRTNVSFGDPASCACHPSDNVLTEALTHVPANNSRTELARIIYHYHTIENIGPARRYSNIYVCILL